MAALTLGAAIVGVVGLALTALGYALAPARAMHAYLTAYAFVATTAVGALVLMLAGYAANARWMAPLRRLQEAITRAFVPLALLFVPIALAPGALYPWIDPPPTWTAHELHVVEAKHAYLNGPAFVFRAAMYLVIWIVAAGLLARWSRARDVRPPDPRAPEAALGRERAFASAMLPPVGLAITFAGFDWLMSLEPRWYSAIFGLYVFVGGFVASVAVLILVARRVGDPLTPNHFHALGRLLFGLSVLWAYLAFFQIFLIQLPDRPIEVIFYERRNDGGWGATAAVVAATRFVLPFLLLLPRAPKLRPRYLAAVATIVLAGHYLDLYWLVLPAHDATVSPHWVDLAALAGVAGVATAWCAWRQRGVPAIAARDPFLPEGLRYASPT